MNQVEFTLKDAQGAEHAYMITPHKTTDGVKLCLRVMALAGEPIGRLVSSNIGELVDLFNSGAIDIDGALDEEIAKLKDLDIDLAQVVRDIQGAIADAGDEEFLISLLKHTYRDGEPATNPQNFDRFYQANYLELFSAAWQAIQANGFLGSWGIS